MLGMKLQMRDFGSSLVDVYKPPPVRQRSQEWSWILVQAMIEKILEQVCYQRNSERGWPIIKEECEECHQVLTDTVMRRKSSERHSKKEDENRKRR
jgi:hypothetical protein